MKKILICLITFMAFITLTGCEDKLKTTIKDTAELNEIDGVTMTIKKDTLTRTGATIIITDVSGKSNIYGADYRIDKKENSSWTPLKSLDGREWTQFKWNAIGYTVDKNNKLEMDINWEKLYGKLEDGEYRIVKSTDEYLKDILYIKYFSVEFIIGE